jgi:hypothetical protein
MRNPIDELDIIDEGFEIFDNMNGNNQIFVPLMEEYPNPKNQFDIQMGVDGSEIDPEVIEQTLQNAGRLIGTLSKTEEEKQLKLRCGRRPILAKNRASYDACSQKFFEQNSISRSAFDPYIPTRRTTENGMSTGAIVGIVAVSGLVIFVGGYFLLKSMKQGK